MPDSASSPGAVQARTVIRGVVRQAVRDARAAGLLLLEPDSAGGRLLRDWLDGNPDAGDVVRPPGTPDPVRGRNGTIDAEEYGRAAARVLARERNLLLAHPACKTVLLLTAALPPERVLPLGDVWATNLLAWTGGADLPPDVDELAGMAGGVERLDSALRTWLDMRWPLERALSDLDPAACRAVRDRLEQNRPLRRWPRCVPKLAQRTLWIDVFA